MFLIVLGYIICLHGVFSMLNLAAFLAVPKLNQVWRDWRGHGRKFASNPRLSELTAIYEELAVARLRMGLEAFESRWLASVELTHHDHVIWCMSWLHDIVYMIIVIYVDALSQWDCPLSFSYSIEPRPQKRIVFKKDVQHFTWNSTLSYAI